MINKNDCIKLANKLITELKLDHKPIESLIEINGEFIWNTILNLFETDLLPKFKNLDCINETEEFQFILDALKQIFDLDLKGVNPAYLTRRKPEYIKLVLNTLLLANYYIKKKSNDNVESKKIDDLLELSSSLSSNDFFNESKELVNSSDLSSNKLSVELRDLTDSSDLEDSDEDTSVDNKKVKIKNSIKSQKKGERESSLSIVSKNSMQNKVKNKVKSSKKELTNAELDDQLKQLDENKKLINKFTYVKEQNFALEISYKIMDVINIQKKSKEIKTNLNQMKMDEVPSNRLTRKKSNRILKKKTTKSKKVNNKKTTYQNLSDVINQLSGLTNKQIKELKEKDDHQKHLIGKLRYDLVEVEKRLNSQMEAKLEKENKLLELLRKDLDLNLNILDSKKELNKRQELNRAKNELYRERAILKKEVDELYQTNLKDLKHLENEQERRLRELTRKKDELFKEDLNELRKELKEYEQKKKNDQNLLFDNYDNFYKSQTNLIKQEIVKQKSENDPIDYCSFSLSKHLEQSFKNKLYPKFI